MSLGGDGKSVSQTEHKQQQGQESQGVQEGWRVLLGHGRV